MSTARKLIVVAAFVAACGGGSAEPRTSSSQHAVDVNQLFVYWAYNFQYNGSGEGFYLGPIRSDADRQDAVRAALARRENWCHVTGAGDPCLQNAVAGLRVSLCPTATSGSCSNVATASETGWAPLMSRYATENAALVSYLESHGYPASSFRQVLQDIKEWQQLMAGFLADQISGKTTSTQIAQAAHDRIAAMAGPEISGEQMQLAETRRSVAALEQVTATYQTELDAVQPDYGDIAARHAAYRATEADVFAGITAIATQASTADLPGLAALKVQLAEKSDGENRAPQLLIVDAKRVLWTLARLQADYEAGVAPYQAYLTEHALPVLDHTSAPKAGMNNVVAYAESRMQRVNDAVRTIYDGIRRREAALSLAAADAATRDQLRAADATASEAAFLDDTTARVNAMWAAPPTGALNLALQGERMATMTSFLQLQSVCRDMTQAAWRAPGCQKVSGEVSKINTYLGQTLPFTLRFGVQKMRTAGFNNTVLSDIEAKLTAGDLKQAVQLYDAIVRSGGEI